MPHHLTIQGPGRLWLVNSTVSTWLDQINSYPKLNMHVSGTLEMDTGSQLKFPGTLNAYANSEIVMRDSVITGFSTQELGTYVGGNTDEYDDAPVMTFTSSTVELYDSRIEKIYENLASPGPDFRYNITLEGTTEMTIVNSYVGVDFSGQNQPGQVDEGGKVQSGAHIDGTGGQVAKVFRKGRFDTAVQKIVNLENVGQRSHRVEAGPKGHQTDVVLFVDHPR